MANFISLLVQKVGHDIKPFTSMLLRLLFPAVKEERSAATKRAFASACAVVLKYATASQAQKLVEDTIALHTGDRNEQMSCAILLKSFASTALDVISGYYAEIIPVIFISRYQNLFSIDIITLLLCSYIKNNINYSWNFLFFFADLRMRRAYQTYLRSCGKKTQVGSNSLFSCT